MAERKHIAESVLDVIDIQRKVREAAGKLPEPLSNQIELSLNTEVDRLQGALQSSWNACWRLLSLVERLIEGKAADHE